MMTVIVAQKQMNLPRLIVVIWSAIVLALSGNELSARAAEPQLGNSKRTFADWCRQKADLSSRGDNPAHVPRLWRIYPT